MYLQHSVLIHCSNVIKQSTQTQSEDRCVLLDVMHLTEVVYLYKQYTSYIQIKEVKQRTVAVISQICLVSHKSNEEKQQTRCKMLVKYFLRLTDQTP